jgi:DHA3 family multidrug efflux protein-like MFS transporter
VFAHVLASSLVVSVANFTVWFAVTFWTYLETRSVLATGLIAGIFLVATAATGIWFGSLVDHHRGIALVFVVAGIIGRPPRFRCRAVSEGRFCWSSGE